MNLFNGKLSQHGFSVSEMLVSITIIGMISALFFVNYRTAGVRSDLINTANKAAADIRSCQGYALGSRAYGQTSPPGGWGVYFNSTAGNNGRYIVFADIGDAPDKLYSGSSESDASKGGRTIQLPSRLEISSIKVAGSVVNSASIVFSPPDPQTFVNGSQNDNALIVLREKNNFTTSTIEVNPFGLVDVIK